MREKPARRQPHRPTGLNASLPSGAAREAVGALGRRIVAGAWPPGATIPIEAELGQTLGVSRATVRDAVKVLSGKGLLRTARRYGTRVRPLEEWHLLDPEAVGLSRGAARRAGSQAWPMPGADRSPLP